MTPLAALILAAGASRRMGVSKPLVRDETGRTLLGRAIATARGAGLAPLAAVRAGEQAVAAQASVAGAQVIEVPDASEGMAASIRAGVATIAADPEAAGVLIMLADQWRLTSDDLRRLVSAWSGSTLGLAAARYEGVLGVPALFSREHFPLLQGLSGDKGARESLRQREAEVVAVEMPSAAVDLDTPTHLARYAR